MCDPVIGRRVTYLPVSVQCWLANRADCEHAGQYVSLSRVTREQSRVGRVQLLVDNC